MEVVLVVIDPKVSKTQSQDNLLMGQYKVLDKAIQVLNGIDDSKARVVGICAPLDNLPPQSVTSHNSAAHPYGIHQMDPWRAYLGDKGVSPMQNFVIQGQVFVDGIMAAFKSFRDYEGEIKVMETGSPKYGRNGEQIAILESWERSEYDKNPFRIDTVHIVTVPHLVNRTYELLSRIGYEKEYKCLYYGIGEMYSSYAVEENNKTPSL